MTQHAIFSPSSSHRWLECPASVRDSADIYSEGNEASFEGTAIHSLVELYFNNNISPIEKLNLTVENVLITDELVELANNYINYINRLISENNNNVLFSEIKSKYSDDCFGTADSIIINDIEKNITVVDLKTGRSRVSAIKNSQLMLYALAYITEHFFDDFYENYTFKLHIYQPRLGNISTHEVSYQELIAFAKKVDEAIKNANSSHPKYATGMHCTFCPARSNCVFLFEDGEREIKKLLNIDIKTIDNNRLVDVFRQEEFLTEFMKGVRSKLNALLTSGDQISGVKLVHANTKRRYTDDAMNVLVDALGEKALKQQDPELIGITEAQKLVGKKVIDTITFKPDGALTVVLEDDPRTAVNINLNL